MPRQTILDFLTHHCETAGHQPAALYKRDGAYQSITWQEVGLAVNRRATALVDRGVVPGAKVVVLSQSRLEWVLWDLAIIAAGAVTVPIYQSCLADDCQYIIDHSGAELVITEDAAQTAKLRQERARLSPALKVVQIDGEPQAGDDWVASERACLAAVSVVDEAALLVRRRALTPDSPLSIIYTSGTTGRPKGVLISHRNLVTTAEAVIQTDVVRSDDIQLLFLPLAHVFARVLMIAWLATRHQLAFAENMQTLRQNLIEIRPTIMGGVPRVFEKFYAAVQQKGAASGRLKAALVGRALSLSEQVGDAHAAGTNLPLPARLQFAAFRRLVFAAIGRELNITLGGRMRTLISGGAPLSPSIAWFFQHANLTLLEGFGLTETTAASCINLPGRLKIGSVGPPLPHTQVRLASDGELLIKGSGVFAGYWNNPDATAAAFNDGWFATGDIARIDDDGYVTIVDRKKDIIVTAGGKNVAPQNIENLIKTSPMVSQVVVHGDRRPFLSALVTLDPDALKAFAKAHSLGGGSLAELSQNPAVVGEMQAIIDRFNSQLPRWETIKKFRLLEHDFSVDNGELTPSLKVKRKLVTQRYQAILDGFYLGGHDGGA